MVEEKILSDTTSLNVKEVEAVNFFFFLGLGSAFLYQAAAIVVTKYFKKRLAFSTAIARSGMGFTFFLAPFTKLLIDLYDWTGESIKTPQLLALQYVMLFNSAGKQNTIPEISTCLFSRDFEALARCQPQKQLPSPPELSVPKNGVCWTAGESSVRKSNTFRQGYPFLP